MANTDKEGVSLGPIAKEVLESLDEFIDIPSFFRTARFIADELKIFSDLLFAIAKFFGDERRRNGGVPLLLELAEVFEINRISLELVFRILFHNWFTDLPIILKALAFVNKKVTDLPIQ